MKTKAEIEVVVRAMMPNARKEQVFTVTRASDGTILFENNRTSGLIKLKEAKFFYNSRNKNRNKAKEIKVGREFVRPFVEAAKLSAKAEKQLLGDF